METSIVTFNIRYIYDGEDEVNNFVHRAGLIYKKISAEKPDVIALQEVTEPILDLFEKLFPEYLVVGNFKSADYTGAGVYVAVKKDKYQLLGFETRWLSDTPFVPGSCFEKFSSVPKSFIMTMLRHKESGRVFRLYNAHLDHLSDDARIMGMKKVFELVDEMNGKYSLPYVLLGDFNSVPDSRVVRFCDDRQDMTDVTKNIEITFHGFGKREKSKLDYIYVSKEFNEAVTDVSVWDDQENGIWLSDHYAICMKMNV